METVELVEHRLPSVGQGEREAVARRLWAERERRDTLGYAVGYRAAFEWARERGDHEAVAALAAGRALQAGTPPGVDGPDGARRLVGGRPCGGDLVRPRREVAQSLERPGGVPREEVAAFHRGVRGGATAVWEAVRADVMGRDEADPAEEAAPGGAASGSSTTPPSPGTPPHRREGASRRPAGCLQAAGRHQRDGDRPQRQQPQHSAGSPRNGVPGRNSA